MKKDTIVSKKWFILFVILLLVMMIGSVFDYQISQVLYHPQSVIGMIFAAYGQLPAMICIGIAGTLLLRFVQKERRIKSLICLIFCVLLNILAIIFATLDPLLYIEQMPMMISLMLAIVIIFFSDWTIWKVTKNTDTKKIKNVIIVLLCVVFIEIIMINLIKVLWSRPRMRMIENYSQSSFQPWWIIGCQMKETLMTLGVQAEEFKSFPSGHTGNAACALLLVLIPYLSSQFTTKEHCLWTIGVVFTCLVAFTRIIVGAQFLTDVTVGFLITAVFIFVFLRLLIKEI